MTNTEKHYTQEELKRIIEEYVGITPAFNGYLYFSAEQIAALLFEFQKEIEIRVRAEAMDEIQNLSNRRN